MKGRILAVAAAAVLSTAAPAHAEIIQDFGDVLSGTNGIALGPDGNFWVAEEFNDSVVQMTPAGKVLHRFSVGSDPESVAVGPHDRVWVSVTGANKLVWFDAKSASPTAHDVAVAGSCGPVAIVADGVG